MHTTTLPVGLLSYSPCKYPPYQQQMGGLIMIDCSVEIINHFLCLSSHLTEKMMCLHYKHYLHKYT